MFALMTMIKCSISFWVFLIKRGRGSLCSHSPPCPPLVSAFPTRPSLFLVAHDFVPVWEALYSAEKLQWNPCLSALWHEYRDGPLSAPKYQSLFGDPPGPALKMQDSPYVKSSPGKRPTITLESTNVIFGVAKPRYNGIYWPFSVLWITTKLQRKIGVFELDSPIP